MPDDSSINRGTAESFLNPPASNRSGKSNNGKNNGNGGTNGGISDMLLQSQRANNNGRVS
jgi:hypothetical protein